MADIIAELAAIKIPERVESFRSSQGKADTRKRAGDPATTPCCVYFAPWFVIGEPDWNLEEGCTNVVVGFDPAMAETTSLYVTADVHLKDDAPLGSVCRRCELASRDIFNRERMEAQANAPPLADTDSDLESVHRDIIDDDDNRSGAGWGGSSAGRGGGVSPSAMSVREARKRLSRASRKSSSAASIADLVTTLMQQGGGKTTAEVALQTGRSLDPEARPLGALPEPDLEPDLETPRELITSRFQEQIAALERRLKQRRLQLDYVRKVYYKDVFLIREHTFHEARGAPWVPTFSKDMPSSVEMNEFIRLFDPESTLEVMPKKEIDALRDAQKKLWATLREHKQLQRRSGLLVKRHQKLSKTARLVAQRADKAEATVVSLNVTIDDLRVRLAQREEELREQIKSTNDQASETERLVTQTAEMQTMIESAQAETQTLKAALEDAEKAIRRGKRVKQQLDHSQAENAKLRKQLVANATIAKEKKRLEGEVAQLNGDLEEAKQVLQSTIAKVEELKGELELAQEQAASDMAQARKDIDAVVAELDKYKARLARRVEELQDTEERLSKVTGERDAVTEELEESKALVAKITEELDTTRDKLYELQADLADRVADIKERDGVIEGLQASVASLGERMVEKDAEIARLEPYVGHSHELEGRVEELEASLEKARSWSDGMVDRFGELHYMLHQASDGRKPSDLESDGASALAILKERQRRAETAKAKEDAAAKRRAQARDAARPGAAAAEADAEASADADADGGAAGEVEDTGASAAASDATGSGEATPQDDEEVLKKEQEAFAAMDPESRAYLRRVETEHLMRQKRGKAAEDLSWLENDVSDLKIDGLVENYAEEVVTNREWEIRIREMKEELARKYEGTIRELQSELAQLKMAMKDLNGKADRLTNGLEERDATIRSREATIADLHKTIQGLEARYEEYVAGTAMQSEEMLCMHVYWKESRRAAFRANVELEIVKRGYLRLERELNELRETSSVEIERLTRDAATWMEDAEKFRRKYAEAVKLAEDSIPVVANKSVQVRFGGVHASAQTEVWEGMRRRSGPPPRVDLTLPRGAYYYMPYHAEPFVRPVSAGSRRSVGSGGSSDAGSLRGGDDASSRGSPRRSLSRGRRGSRTRRSVSPLNLRPRSASGSQMRSPSPGRRSRGTGTPVQQLDSVISGEPLSPDRRSSPRSRGRGPRMRARPSSARPASSASDQGTTPMLFTGRSLSAVGAAPAPAAIPAGAGGGGARGQRTPMLSDADLGVVVDDSPDVADVDTWAADGRHDDASFGTYGGHQTSFRQHTLQSVHAHAQSTPQLGANMPRRLPALRPEDGDGPEHVATHRSTQAHPVDSARSNRGSGPPTHRSKDRHRQRPRQLHSDREMRADAPAPPVTPISVQPTPAHGHTVLRTAGARPMPRASGAWGVSGHSPTHKSRNAHPDLPPYPSQAEVDAAAVKRLHRTASGRSKHGGATPLHQKRRNLHPMLRAKAKSTPKL